MKTPPNPTVFPIFPYRKRLLCRFTEGKLAAYCRNLKLGLPTIRRRHRLAAHIYIYIYILVVVRQLLFLKVTSYRGVSKIYIFLSSFTPRFFRPQVSANEKLLERILPPFRPTPLNGPTMQKSPPPVSPRFLSGQESQTRMIIARGVVHACGGSDDHDGSQSPHIIQHAPPVVFQISHTRNEHCLFVVAVNTSHVATDTATPDTRCRPR